MAQCFCVTNWYVFHQVCQSNPAHSNCFINEFVNYHLVTPDNKSNSMKKMNLTTIAYSSFWHNICVP